MGAGTPLGDADYFELAARADGNPPRMFLIAAAGHSGGAASIGFANEHTGPPTSQGPPCPRRPTSSNAPAPSPAAAENEKKDTPDDAANSRKAAAPAPASSKPAGPAGSTDRPGIGVDPLPPPPGQNRGAACHRPAATSGA